MATGVFCSLSRSAYGGIESHNHNMVAHLVEYGEYVEVVAPHFPEDTEFDKTCGYPVVRVDTSVGRGNGWMHIWDRAKMILPTYRTILRVKADYLICGSSDVQSFLFSAYFAAQMAGIPVYAFSLDGPSKINTIIKPLWNNICKEVTFLCISDNTRSRVLDSGVDKCRAITVPCGVCLSEIDGSIKLSKESVPTRIANTFQAEEQTILFLSRLVPRKRADKLIRVMPTVISSIPRARLVIVGDGSERQRLESLVAESSARNSISVLGRVTESEKWICYEQCDVYVLPSIGEGFGIGYLEANALGKPVVGSRDSGTVDAVLHGETGLLVDPNSDEQLAEAIIQLLKNPTLARRLGKNGRRRVEEEMNWATIAARVRDIIHENPRLNQT